MERSAASQDRVAKAYEEVAAHNQRRDEYLKHAARHREFAQEDRLMAEGLRRMAESDWTGNPTAT
jgi:hypothetical protein